ncbi:MAG: ribonuclease E/G [Lachnospiraceae bacterium]|nr:ribonuclease E/G [Lachnospiraceae bacterium]
MSKKLVLTKLNIPSIAPADVAVLYEDNKATYMDIFYEDEPFVLGNIYVAHVNDVVKNINAAFVEYSPGKKAYLSLENTENTFFINRKNTTKICQGDNILVQIKKEPIKTKDAVCSTCIEFSSNYVVLTYGVTGINVSTKIKDNSLRQSLSNYCSDIISGIMYDKEAYGMITEELFYNILSNTGIIVRTQAQDISDYELIKEDILKQFEALFLCFNKALYSKGRTCIYSNENPILSVINKHKSDEIITDNEEIYKLLCEQSIDVKLYEDSLLPLYKLYNIEGLLNDVSSRKVWLKSGAYLVIDYTEAMTVIDVNTGKCEKGKNKEDTILKINLEAAIEAMRQIKLRNISGIIIIDFIDMAKDEAKEALLNQLIDEAKKDNIKTSIMGLTRLNLVEITRKKIRERITIKKNNN